MLRTKTKLCFVQSFSSCWSVFKISAGAQTLTGKICVSPASFPPLSYINFGKTVLRSGKFQILFWRLLLMIMILNCRDHFGCAPSQWETILLCNVISHWLGAYIKWSLELFHFIDQMISFKLVHQGPVSQKIYELINDIFWKKILILMLHSDPIRSKFCTRHDSFAVMTCANLGPNLSIILHIGPKCIFIRYGLWAHKTLSEMVPSWHHSQWCTSSVKLMLHILFNSFGTRLWYLQDISTKQSLALSHQSTFHIK